MLAKILDPSINTIPYLYALLANFNSLNGKPKSTFQSKDFVNGPVWAKTLDFMERFDTAQIRYGGAEFRNLIEKLAEMAKASSTVSLSLTSRCDGQSELTIPSL